MGMGRQAAGLLPELAEHVANESGWLVATGTLSGVGGSTGTFSPTKWREDLATILDRVAEGEPRVSLAGFGFGGALALAVAATDDRVRGVATFAAPAHLAPWCRSPEEIHRAVQISGVVGDGNDLLSPHDLYRDILAIDPMRRDRQVAPAASPDWTRDRRHRGAGVRRARSRRRGRWARRTATDSRRGPSTASRSANGGDPFRLARPPPLGRASSARRICARRYSRGPVTR